MADAREKKVLSELANLVSRTNYVVDNVRSLREPLGRGDSIDVPSISNLTVTADGSGGATPQSVTKAVLALAANEHPTIFSEITALDSMQSLGDGSWERQVAEQALLMLKNDMDNTMCEYLIKTLGYDASATYHNNVAADALTSLDIAGTIAELKENDGVIHANLRWFMHPFAVASMETISGWQPNGTEAANGDLGIRRVGTVFGVPVLETNSCLRRRTVSADAWSVSAGTQSLTVDAGHGIVPGQKITFDTVTAGGDQAAATVVDAVGATQIDFTTSNTGSATEAGTITVESTESILADVSQVFVAQQLMPTVRIVNMADKTSDSLQVSSIWGKVGRTGRVRVLNSPPTL
jgi:hypothetical protein